MGVYFVVIFDIDFMFFYGCVLGREFYNCGVNIVFGFVVGFIGRIIKGGRSWEGGGLDFYLVGKLFGKVIRVM